MRKAVHGSLHTEVMGDPEAPPMVFVHPNPMDGTGWIYQMGHLSTWFYAVTVDLPGYGRSPTAETDVTMAEIAAACWEAVRRRSTKPAVLVGCSVGSRMVMHMYHQDPEHVRAVAVSGAGYNPDVRFTPARIEAYRRRGLDYRWDYCLDVFSPAYRQNPLASWFADVMAERNARADLKTILAMFEAYNAPDPAGLYSELHAPTLILSGTEDNLHAMAFDLHDRLPDSEMVTIAGAGHACQIEQPWTFNRTLLAFLRRRELLEEGLSA